MKLLAGLFGRKTRPNTNDEFDFNLSEQADAMTRSVDALKVENVDKVPAPAAMSTPNSAAAAADRAAKADELAQEISQTAVAAAAETAEASVNIWDMDVDAQQEEKGDVTIIPTSPENNRAKARGRRNRTRLIGFDKSDGDVVDLFDETPQAAASATVQFPVAWLLVVEGPGRGHSFPLVAGMSQIGRGEDQSVRLDFGDNAISRQNHAAIVYDPENRKFMLGHGGKANIVRLNDQPVISNEDLSDGDRIKIGDTLIQLKTMCGEDFDWSDTAGDDEEREDVAIA